MVNFFLTYLSCGVEVRLTSTGHFRQFSSIERESLKSNEDWQSSL